MTAEKSYGSLNDERADRLVVIMSAKALEIADEYGLVLSRNLDEFFEAIARAIREELCVGDKCRLDHAVLRGGIWVQHCLDCGQKRKQQEGE